MVSLHFCARCSTLSYNSPNWHRWVVASRVWQYAAACTKVHWRTKRLFSAPSLTSKYKWFKYDRDWFVCKRNKSVPVIFEPPCTLHLHLFNFLYRVRDLRPRWSTRRRAGFSCATLYMVNIIIALQMTVAMRSKVQVWSPSNGGIVGSNSITLQRGDGIRTTEGGLTEALADNHKSPMRGRHRPQTFHTLMIQDGWGPSNSAIWMSDHPSIQVPTAEKLCHWAVE